jgi:glycosyltransferase involved in cell wall biosynthesis
MTFNSVDTKVSRPLVSFVLITYNQEKFVAEGLRAALRQSYSPLEIIVSDDCSTDKTFEIITQIAEAYSGPHKIILNKNKQNIGITPNFLKAISLSSGTWIVAAAGDDISTDNRVEVLMSYTNKDKGIRGLSSSFKFIDENSEELLQSDEITPRLIKLENFSVENSMSRLRSATQNFNLLGASSCWHRDLFDKFPLITKDRFINEDLVLTWRAKMMGTTKIILDKLVLYRRHSDSVSSLIPKMSAMQLSDKKKKKSLRVRASLIQIMADVDYAFRINLINENQRCEMSSSLEDFIFYHTAIINWDSAGFKTRMRYIIRLWRPGKMRLGLRRLFE